MALLDHILGALKDLQSPQNAGTMGLVQGLLASSGYTRMPTSFGQTLAMGLQGMQQAQSTAARNNLINAQAGFQQYRDDAFKNLLNPQQQQPATPPAQSGIAPLPNLAGAIGGGNGYGAVAPVQGLLGNTQVFNQPQAQAPAPGSAASPVQDALRQSLLYSLVGDAPAAKGVVDVGTAKEVARQKAVGADPVAVAGALGYLTPEQQQQLGKIAAETDAGALYHSSFNGSVGGINPQNGQPWWMGGAQGTQVQNGVLSPIPGAAQTKQILEQAQQQGKTAGTLVKGVTPAGAPTLVPGSTYLSPQVSAAASGTQPAGTAPAPAASGPWNFNRWMPPSPVNIPKGQAGLAPGQASTLKELADDHVEYGKELAEHADAAQATNFQLNNLVSALQKIPSGPGEQWKAEAQGALNSAFQALNLPKLDLNLVNNAAEVNKYGTQLGFTLAKTLGSRESQMVIQQAIHANPNVDTPQGAVQALAAGMHAVANWTLAKQQAYLAYRAKYPNQQVPGYGFQTWFNKNYTPEMFYVVHAPPEQAQEIIKGFTPLQKQNLKQLLLNGMIQ